ncbi:MAG: hypothetical protein GY811_28390 [Myxococcales bacterium]|nr:hypothetical protein [Myxococcales bacterium]
MSVVAMSAVAMSAVAILSRCTEALIAHYGKSEFDDELRCAKDAYSERRGRVFEEDEQWERFTRGLLEWYVVERPWRNTGCAPAVLAQAEERDDETLTALRALASSQRSLAQIRSVKKGRMDVLDMVGGAEFSVQEERSLIGLEKGDIVELRLLGYGGVVSLGRTFLFHPSGTAAAIANIVEMMRGQSASRADIIDRMALLRSRSQSYRHVSPIRIYESNGELASA